MELRITKTLDKMIFSVTIKVVSTDTETDLFKKFGQPEVETGGLFANEDIVFDLESKKRKLPSEFPYVQKFDGVELGPELAQDRAELYKDSMKIRITNVLHEFKMLQNTYTGEDVYTI